jgi:hypothetical protein
LLVAGGFIPLVGSLIGMLFVFGSLRLRLEMSRGKPQSAVVRKVVKLKTITGPIKPLEVVRFQLELPANAGKPRLTDRVFDLAPTDAALLKPGTMIEVICNGPKFIYPTLPIKVLSVNSAP